MSYATDPWPPGDGHDAPGQGDVGDDGGGVGHRHLLLPELLAGAEVDHDHLVTDTVLGVVRAPGPDNDGGPAVGGDVAADGADVAAESEGPCLRVPAGIGLGPVALDAVGEGPRDDLVRGPSGGREPLLVPGEAAFVVRDDDLALR
ncbi:hypothetical protein [Streptomyces sp. NPDC054783]